MSFALAGLLQACGTLPAEQAQKSVVPEVAPASPASASAPGELPELNLNLPSTGACDCRTPAPEADYTFFEKGYRALLDGEYDDAMAYFQRYQRLETSPRADLEAGIAIAYIRMLPRSSFYDPRVARSSFSTLRELNPKQLKVHDYTRLMRQALLNLLELQDKIDSLKSKNATLNEDLQKREEALKRLRDLTLNQKAPAQ